MDLSPDQITRLTALAVLLVAGIDLGIAFLLAVPREASNERD